MTSYLPILTREIMPITESQLIILSIYTVLFVIIIIFFEIRLNYIHKRHIEKVWPIGEDGLKLIDRKLKFIVRGIFGLLFAISVAIILTIL